VANQEIYDLTVESQIKYIRYSNQKVKEAMAIVEEGDNEIINWIQTFPWRNPDVDRLEGILAKQHSRITQFIQETMDEIALFVVAVEFAALANFIKNVANPTKVAILDRVRTRLMEGAVMRDWVKQHNQGDRGRTIRRFKDGMERKLTRQALRREVVGTVSRRRKDGIRQMTRIAIETLTRTAIVHAVNSGRQAVHMANAEHIKHVVWVSVLDTRTSEICRHLDGTKYPVDSGLRPPAHPNCRSVVVPVLSGQPFKRENWYEWFARQPDEVKKEAVGAKRFALLKKAGMRPGQFSNAAGERYTLDELQERMPAAFKRAGLS